MAATSASAQAQANDSVISVHSEDEALNPPPSTAEFLRAVLADDRSAVVSLIEQRASIDAQANRNT